MKIHSMKLAMLTLISTVALARIAQADIDTLLPDGQSFQKKAYVACHQALKPCQGDREAYVANIACTKQVYAKQPLCRQAQAIESQTGGLPDVDAIHTQGQVTWFSVHYLADGGTNYFMLDSTGRLLSLATSQTPLIAQSPLYQNFMKPYPQGALQSDVTTKLSDTPQVRQQSDGSLQLIFKQIVKSQDCRACQPVGVAQLVYYFDAQGRYQAVQLVSIDAMTV